MSLSAMTDIIDPYHFTAGSAPLLISIPHAGTQLTPEVDNGLSDAARPLGDTDWHIPRLYDFAHALGAMSPKLREVCRRLMSGTISSTARAFSALPRSPWCSRSTSMIWKPTV